MIPVEEVLDLQELTSRLSTVDGARSIGIREIDIGSGALLRLPELLDRLLRPAARDQIVILVDGTAMNYAGTALYDSVTSMLGQDRPVRVAVARTHEGRAHADEQTLADVARPGAG